jgi:hypothetical protein
MVKRIFSLAPNQLPPLSAMIENISGADNNEQLAKYLGVQVDQLTNWKIAEDAPRSVMLALFWETKWGASVLNCQAQNSEKVWRDLALSNKREIDTLRARITRIESLGHHGSANSPLWHNDFENILTKKA